MSDWWLSRSSGAPEGPFPTHVLAQGLSAQQIPHQAYVCRVGDQRWLRISQVDEICGAAASTGGPSASAASSPEPDRQIATHENAATPPQHHDIDDEDNERTQIITAQPGAAAPATVARSVLTPLPNVPIISSDKNGIQQIPPLVPPRTASALQLSPLPLPQAAPQARGLVTPPIGSASGPLAASPVVPTLSRVTPGRNQASTSSASSGTPLEPYRAKVPTLEGIQANPNSPKAQSQGATTPGGAAAPASGQSLRSALSGPGPLGTPARQQSNLPPVAHHPSQLSGASAGLTSLGLAPLSKPPGHQRPIQGLTPLAANVTGAGVPATSIKPDPTARGTEVHRAMAPAAPGLLGFFQAPAPTSENSVAADVECRVPPQSIGNGPLGAPEVKGNSPDKTGLADADVDEVTTIATSALAALSSTSTLASGFDDDETQIVPQARLPQSPANSATTGAKPPLAAGSGRRPAAAPGESPSGSGQSSGGMLDALDFTKKRVGGDAPTAPSPIVTPASQAEGLVATHSAANHKANASKLDPSPHPVARVVAAPPPPSDDFDPSELLEVETDDAGSIPRVHGAPKLQPNTAPAGNVSQPAPANPVRPIISQPPRAIHQPLAPSVVLNPEPIVHQEATRPALRALKQPGVIQITYGTLVVVLLAVALLVLVIVLVVKA